MKKFSRAFYISLFLLLLLTAWLFGAPLLAERLIVEKPLEHADAILVLAGSSVYLERTNHAAEIFAQGIAPKIILTDDGEKAGWSRLEQRNPPYVELARKNLISKGVPVENIEIIVPNGSGTIYEARIFSETARLRNWKSILLVTSPYHTRRTLQTFERETANEKIVVGIAASTAQPAPASNFWWFSARGWNSVAGEYVKSFYYWVYY